MVWVSDLKEMFELNTAAINGYQGLKEMEIHLTHIWKIVLTSNDIVHISFKFLETLKLLP
jgi:hypothetical protein